MADEIKKKPAAKKEGKPEAPGEQPAASAAAGEPQAAKGPKKHSAPAPDVAAPAAEAPKPAEGAAPAVAAPTAAELLADDMAGKKIIKAKGAKNIVSGIANIL